MSKKNPLRRLSVALGLKAAFEPAQPLFHTGASTISSDGAQTTSRFLRETKERFLVDFKEDPIGAGEKWTMVIGNEAGDLDSIASSIGYAWILTSKTPNPINAIPLIQLAHADLTLRPENLYAFKLVGLSDSLAELLTLSDISQFNQDPPFRKFALVDHNRLAPTFASDKAEVLSVIDHHADEGLYKDTANPRVIEPVGSCSSLVTAQLYSPPPTIYYPEILPDLALLLLTAPLLDTDGLKPHGKAIAQDRASALYLAPKSTISNLIPPLSALSPIDRPNGENENPLYDLQAIKDLTKTLRDKKADVSALSPYDLLRRDYKEYTFLTPGGDDTASGVPITVKVGISTVVAGLKAWATDGRIEDAAVRWMKERGVNILGVCTSFRDVNKGMKKKDKDAKGKHKREQVWITLPSSDLQTSESSSSGNNNSNSRSHLTVDDVDRLAKRLFIGLESSGDTLELEKYKKFSYLEKTKSKSSKFPRGSRVKVWKQKNVDASRKVIAPLVKEVLEGESGPTGGGAKE